MTIRAGQVRLGADRCRLDAVADRDEDDCSWPTADDRNSEELGTAEAQERLILANGVCERESECLCWFLQRPIFISLVA